MNVGNFKMANNGSKLLFNCKSEFYKSMLKKQTLTSQFVNSNKNKHKYIMYINVIFY